MDTTKQDHLIERAAALLRQPVTPVTETKLAPPSPGRNPSALPLRQQSPKAEGVRKEPEVSKPRLEHNLLAQAGLFEAGGSYSRPAEEFRIIQKKLLQSLSQTQTGPHVRANLVMITSALKGEGKSFVSINLAAEAARHGDRQVLLVDADPKPLGLRQKLGLTSAPGLLDLARSVPADAARFVMPTNADHLNVLPLGTDPKGGIELLTSKRMAEAIENLSRRYPEWLIFFDAPPCLASSIPHTLAGLMGHVILVVAANSTQQDDVEAALDLVQACPQVSLLLNKIPAWSTHSFGAYDYVN